MSINGSYPWGTEPSAGTKKSPLSVGATQNRSKPMFIFQPICAYSRMQPRCLIRVRANLARTLELSGWRQHKSLREKLRKKYQPSRKGRSSEYKLSKVRTYLHFCLRMAKKARFFLDALEQTIRAKPRPSPNDPPTLQLLCETRQQICMYSGLCGPIFRSDSTANLQAGTDSQP